MPSSPTTLDSVGLPLGASAVDFQLKGVDGKTHSLNKFSDKKALVVIFSCNHCPYVQAYEDRMVQIQKDYSAKGVTLVAINSNDDSGYPEDSYPNMIKRAKERGFNFPYLRDDTQEIAKKYGAVCTPHVFAFDQQRRLQYKGRIDDNRNPESVKTKDLRDALDAMLAGQKPSLQETRPFGCSVKWKN
ncbi:MAG: thioredoxin family protein [Crenarchaeota archaeon 13_1_40CM_2_52_14]|nr:MAG: thioredoxin family protein [Crenarchaeota archaeon 13_1_40CM_2_52_14]OLE69093.1 MAG: thioredoxin family protein [archaeon 13_1_20CM_2_51_12]